MDATGRNRDGVADLGREDFPADTEPWPPDEYQGRGVRRSRAAGPRSRRLALGVAVAVPLTLALALAAALGGATAFLAPTHHSGAATDPGSGLTTGDAPSLDGSGAPGTPAVSQVRASGDTVVAVGSQGSATPSFSVSTDAGRTWTLAVTRSQAGPVTGHQATTVAGGPGGWVGLGPHAIWTSPDGATWTLVSARGLVAPGETITGVTKDSWGYLATGTSAQAGTGLVWTSPNGLAWHRFTAAQFGLVNAPGERVFAMTDAATDWSVTLIAGSATKDGKTCAYVWRSLDNGASWRTVVVPQTDGGGWSFAGLAGDAGHFIAVRQGTAAGGLPDAVVYASDDAVNWHFAVTIGGSAGFSPQQVTGGSGGTGRFVITGHDQQGHAVAYTSTDNGATWTQSDGFGVLPTT
jgi:hypothetical protein